MMADAITGHSIWTIFGCRHCSYPRSLRENDRPEIESRRDG